jgi:hypothetical protein
VIRVKEGNLGGIVPANDSNLETLDINPPGAQAHCPTMNRETFPKIFLTSSFLDFLYLLSSPDSLQKWVFHRTRRQTLSSTPPMQCSCTKYPTITADTSFTNLYRRMFGLFVAWRLRGQTKSEFLSSNRTQKGQNQDPLKRSCTQRVCYGC